MLPLSSTSPMCFFEGEGEELLTKIAFSDFMSRMLKLRGSNTATVKDLVDLRKWMHKELLQLRKLNSRISMAMPIPYAATLVPQTTTTGPPFEYVLHV